VGPGWALAKAEKCWQSNGQASRDDRSSASAWKDRVGDGCLICAIEIVGIRPVNTLSSGFSVGIPGTGFSNPAGVAVDGAGDVFVVDAGNNAVKDGVGAYAFAIDDDFTHDTCNRIGG
jgi:hypothetical protein